MEEIRGELKQVVTQWLRNPNSETLRGLVTSSLSDKQVKDYFNLVMEQQSAYFIGDIPFWNTLASQRPYLVSYFSLLQAVEMFASEDSEDGVSHLKDLLGQGYLDTMNPYGIKALMTVWETYMNRLVLYWMFWDDVERRVVQWEVPNDPIHVAKNRTVICVSVQQWEKRWESTRFNIKEDALYQVIKERYRGWFGRSIEEDYLVIRKRNADEQLNDIDEWLDIGCEGI